MELRPIKNLPYKISSSGQVFDLTNKLVTLTTKNGFVVVKINNELLKVHRLVAESFVPNPENYKYILHKDKNKQNNNVTNLFWNKTSYVEGTDLTAKVIIKKEKQIAVCQQCKCDFEKTSKRKIFCSLNCGNAFKASKAGRASAEKISSRSKNEILFAEKCISHFGQENVLTNKAIFNGWDADVILSHLKIAILWNGKWHYEKIRAGHNLLQVQNRDKIKEKEILNKGYKVFIVKDMGKFSVSKVNEEFDKLLSVIS